MSAFESELENLLGEFHIRMKGEPTEISRSAFSTFAPSLLAAALKWPWRDVFLYSEPLFVSFLAQVWQVSPGCVQETSTRQVPFI